MEVVTGLIPGGHTAIVFNFHFEAGGRPALKFRIEAKTGGETWHGDAVGKISIQRTTDSTSNALYIIQSNEFSGPRAALGADIINEASPTVTFPQPTEPKQVSHDDEDNLHLKLRVSPAPSEYTQTPSTNYLGNFYHFFRNYNNRLP